MILSFNQPFTDFRLQVTSSKAQTDHRPGEAQRNSVRLVKAHITVHDYYNCISTKPSNLINMQNITEKKIADGVERDSFESRSHQ